MLAGSAAAGVGHAYGRPAGDHTGARARWSCKGSSAVVSCPSAVRDKRLNRTAACAAGTARCLLDGPPWPPRPKPWLVLAAAWCWQATEEAQLQHMPIYNERASAPSVSHDSAALAAPIIVLDPPPRTAHRLWTQLEQADLASLTASSDTSTSTAGYQRAIRWLKRGPAFPVRWQSAARERQSAAEAE